MSGQPTIYTIHESQLNNGGGGGGQQRQNSNPDAILIDTSSIPTMSQQTMPPLQHQHQLQPQQAYADQMAADGANAQAVTTSQPTSSGGGGGQRVAPESQSMVYSVHPVFNTLDQHDALLVRQRAHAASTCCGFESENAYTVRAKDGSPVLKAIESSNCCERCCFEGNREYNLSLMHNDECVARVRKSYHVSRFCCYSNAVRIESPEDNPVGYIRQMFTLFGHPRYAIYDCQQPPKAPSFYLESTSCRWCCTPLLCTCMCGNNQFRIVAADTKEQVGTIQRQWSADLVDDNATVEQANHAAAAAGDEPFGGENDQMFGIQFESATLEPRHKVLLLSACFMMDFFYFENDRRRRKLASC